MSRFALTLFIALAHAATAAAQAGTWQIDPNHSSAQFSVRHLGVSTVRGAFTKVSGSAQLRSHRTHEGFSRRHDRSEFGRHARGNARQRPAQSEFPRRAEVSDDYVSFQAGESRRTRESCRSPGI